MTREDIFRLPPARAGNPAVWKQAEEHFGRLIAEGRLKPGDRLPNSPDLLRIMGISQASLQRALHVLVRRGLIERRPRHGTYVMENGAQALGVAVMTRAPFDPGMSEWDHLGAQAVVRVFSGAGRAFHFYQNQYLPGTRPEDDVQRVCPTLLADLGTARIGGLLVLGRIPDHDEGFRARLARRGIPVVELAPARTADRQLVVAPDYGSILEAACARFRDLGLDEPALIAPRRPAGEAPWAERFAEAAARYGLRTRASRLLETQRQTAEEGRRAMAALCRKRPRPGALLVMDDVVASGAQAALLDRGLRCPEDVHMITHWNKGSRLVLPMPADRIAFDAEKIVTAAWDMMQAALEGRAKEGCTIGVPADPLVPGEARA